MDRRGALGVAGVLSAVTLGAHKASACSLVALGADEYTQRLPVVAKLFDAWFDRNDLGFVGVMTGPRSSGSIKENFVRGAMAAAKDREPQRLFDTMFADRTSLKRLLCMTSVGDNVFAAVTEQGESGIGADCTNLPTLHLFLIGFSESRPATINLVKSEMWNGYAQMLNWSAPH